MGELKNNERDKKYLHWLKLMFIEAKSNSAEDEFDRIKSLEKDISDMLEKYNDAAYPETCTIFQALDIVNEPDKVKRETTGMTLGQVARLVVDDSNNLKQSLEVYSKFNVPGYTDKAELMAGLVREFLEQFEP